MRKTGERITHNAGFSPAATLAFLLFVAVAPLLIPQQHALASDVRLTASVSNANPVVGERFTLNVELQSREPRNLSRPELPQLEGMRYLSTVPSTSTSYSLVNGVARMTYRYSFTIQAADSGAFQIPEVYIDVDGTEYATRPVTVIIRAPGDDESQRPGPARSQQPDIFLDMELSEERPVRGQQIVAEVVLYFRENIEVRNFNIAQSWQTEGFWREDLNQSQTRRPESVVLQGESYRRAVLARYALFPTRSGELTVPSYGIRASVRQSGSSQQSGFGSIFDGFGRQREIRLETSPITMRVLPPPAPPADGQLISALGRFTINRTLSQDRVKLGEAVDVITEISGTGNLGLITRPVYEYPVSFDTHRPREIVERDFSAPRMAGTKQFRDVLIARNAGTYTIPETTIHIYNDATRRYEPHQLPELTLEVVRDPNARVMLAHSDEFRLTPARGSVAWTQSTPAAFYGSWLFWLALILPMALFLYGVRVRQYRQKLTSDRRFSRYEQALGRSTSLLDSVSAASDAKTLYRIIYKAVTNFITDRLDLPAAGFTEKQLVDELRSRNVERPLCDRILRLLNKCATIRYAPDPSPADAAGDLAEARNLISQLKIQL
ncbi:BatD family protein [Balneolales bacterium ANBcel1]|nr:BatD family protein [Balneolales bacterium ANBcel1]